MPEFDSFEFIEPEPSMLNRCPRCGTRNIVSPGLCVVCTNIPQPVKPKKQPPKKW